MVAQPTIAAPPVAVVDPLFRLDYASLTLARSQAVAVALLDLVKGVSAEDLALLVHLHGCATLLAAKVGTTLAGGAVSPASAARPAGASAKLDVSDTLRAWHRRELETGDARTLLVAVLVNAALDPDRGGTAVERSYIGRLGEMIRGALTAGDKAPLLVLLAGTEGIQGLLSQVDRNRATSKRVHITFESLWNRWLRDRLLGWVEGEPSHLRHRLVTGAPLQPDVDAPSVELGFAPELDADTLPALPAVAIDAAEFGGLDDDAVRDHATALQFLRGSAYGGLSLSSDHYMPDELVCQIVAAGMRRAQDAFQAGLLDRAEQVLALLFSVATGLRGIEIQDVVWGVSDGAGAIFLDPQKPVLSVPLKRPSNAVDPEGIDGWLKPVAERFESPVPPSLHAAIRRLAGKADPDAGVAVFPHADRSGKPNGRAVDILSSLVPGIQVGAGRVRMALAAKVSQRFGPEVTQLILRDSLFTTLGPAYYCAVPSQSVAECVAAVQHAWFGEEVPFPAHQDLTLGSRLVLSDAGAAAWPSRLKKRSYSVARKKGAAAELLQTERDRLAATLSAATGNRPGNSLGDLRLESVVPEYGLVILQDKQEDPLRRTRIAATGQRWIADLRGYLDAVVDLSRKGDAPTAAWAAGVLDSTCPLFSLPAVNGTPVALDAATLRATMPPELAAVDNFYRHRLNQALQAKDVDWELRHAQLGWIVSPAFALADLSPISPQILAERIGPVIDDVLVQDGWYGANHRIRSWDWSGVPMPPLADWKSRVAGYEHDHEEATRRLHQAYEARSGEVKPVMLECLGRAVETCLPRLRVDAGGRTLVPASKVDGKSPVQLSMEHYELLLERVRHDRGTGYTPLEQLVAEKLLHEVVVNSIRDRVVVGPEPRYRRVGFTAQLSPFLPGIGMAVRQTHAIRERLNAIANNGKESDRAAIVQLSIIASTPYRDLARSVLLLKAASRAVRGASHPAWIRVPARDRQGEMPAVLGGVTGIALARSGKEAPTRKPLRGKKLTEWMAVALDGVIPMPPDLTILPELLASTCRIAGLVELDGPGRLVMDAYPLAAVDTERELAENERWPPSTSSKDEPESGDGLVTRQAVPRPPVTLNRFDSVLLHRLTKALHPSTATASRKRKTSSRRGWRQQMENDLRDLLKDADPSSNFGLVAEYALHRCRFGGKRVKNLKEGTLRKEIGRFARGLLAGLGPRPLLALSSKDIEAAYLTVLCGKPKDEHADVLEELIKFHGYLEFTHHAPVVTFARLRTFAGPRVRRADKGTLTQPEVELIRAELEADAEREKQRVDASPEATRVCELRVVLFHILEAAGIRPASAGGLLLGDLHLLGPGRDFVHVHTSGGYGSAKTSTSKGFVPCDGELWASHRDRIIDWISGEKSRLGSDWWKLPLFADAIGSHVCFSIEYLASRIGELAKWVTGTKRARTYWLRKRRMTQRLRDSQNTAVPLARSAYRALHMLGEADILTPLHNYVHDAAVPLHTYLESASQPDRSGVLAVSGLRATPLDMRWHKRRGKEVDYFFGTVLDALEIGFAPVPEGSLTLAPALYRQRPLLPLHVDRYARLLQKVGDRAEAMVRCGLSDRQADLLDDAVHDMVVSNGAAPWLLPEVRQPAAMMHSARRLHGAEKLFNLLNRRPDASLVALADAFVCRGHLERMHGREVIVALRGATECDAARAFVAKGLARIEYAEGNGSGGVLRLAGADMGDKKARRNAHGDALRWILAVVWLYTRIANEARSDDIGVS